MIELLADGILADNNFGDTRSGGLAGPTGLVIILLLVVGTVLLIRSMNAHLRRLPERFSPPPPPPVRRNQGNRKQQQTPGLPTVTAEAPSPPSQTSAADRPGGHKPEPDNG